MKVLVTGATGLVGSRLLPRLIKSGYDCRTLLRSNSSGPSEIECINGDLLVPDTLKPAVEGVDAIVHLAAVLRSIDPNQIWSTNVEGTRNLIDAARIHAPNVRFIFASTGLVYEKDSLRPALEEDRVNPERDYPASKLLAEKKLRESRLNWSILRLGFVYGDGDGHLDNIQKIAQLLKLHPANRLSMIHHFDIFQIVQMALKGALDGKAVNVVDDAPMSIFELCEIAGTPMQPTAEPLVCPWAGILDGSLARRLGFRPEIATIWQAAHQKRL